jgi:hypothetical protein
MSCWTIGKRAGDECRRRGSSRWSRGDARDAGSHRGGRAQSCGAACTAPKYRGRQYVQDASRPARKEQTGTSTEAGRPPPGSAGVSPAGAPCVSTIVGRRPPDCDSFTRTWTLWTPGHHRAATGDGGGRGGHPHPAARGLRERGRLARFSTNRTGKPKVPCVPGKAPRGRCPAARGRNDHRRRRASRRQGHAAAAGCAAPAGLTRRRARRPRSQGFHHGRRSTTVFTNQ